jgi:hypothetical protein
VLAMFLAYPLAGILSLLPGAHLKHLFSLLVGLWYAQEIFGGQWIHSFASALVSYLIVVLAPRKHIASLVSVEGWVRPHVPSTAPSRARLMNECTGIVALDSFQRSSAAWVVV